MYIISHEHKVIAVPATPDLNNIYPDQRRVTVQGNEHIVFPHDEPTTVALRRLGHDVPAPVLHHYDWGLATPYKTQRETVSLMTLSQRAYILNTFGTGKTKSALWAADRLKKQGLINRILVVAPLSTLRFTWQHEIIATVPHLKVNVLHHASRKKRLELLKDEADIYVVNHDGLKLISEEVMKRADIDCLVIDELAVYRNGTAARTKHMRKFAQHFKFAWGLTGSPTPEAPTDAWAQATILTPDRAPKSFLRCRDDLMIKISDYKWVPKQDALQKVHTMLQPAVRYTLDDTTELPECVERTLEVEVGIKQKKLYDDMRRHAYALYEKKEITGVNEGVVLGKLLQISTGWVYSTDRGVVQLDGDKRLDCLMDLIDDIDSKVIVFVPFIHALDGIVARLKHEGVSVEQVSGDTPVGRRSEIFTSFQSGTDPRVLVAHPGCMSHGLTLTAASTIIWYAPIASLETFEQANARIRRIGTTQRQQIIMLQGTPVERKLYAKLRSKQKLQNMLLEMFETNT